MTLSSNYNDEKKLHELFEQKGFEKYSAEQMVERRKMMEAETKPANVGVRGGAHAQRAKRRAEIQYTQHKNKMDEATRTGNKKELKRLRDNYMMVGMPHG